MAASCGPRAPGAGTDGGRGGHGASTSPPSWCYWGLGGPSGCGGHGQLSWHGQPRWGHRRAWLCRGVKVMRQEGADPRLWAPAHSRGQMAQDVTRHRSCLLLSEPVWPHDRVCGAGMALRILCGALWVLHGPAALLQVLHGSVPLAVAPAWMHSADCGSCTAPQSWVQALHSPAVLLQGLQC